MRYSLYIALSLGLLAASCASKKKSMPTEVEVQASQVYFRVETTPCFGACPIYSMEFEGLRNVRYTAGRFTDPMGNFSASVADSAFTDMFSALEAIQWDSLEPRYMTGYTDLPSVVLRYSEVPGDTSEVTYEYEAAPLELQSLFDQIEIGRKMADWKSVDLH